MDVTPPVARFEQAYRDGDPPWVIGEPQPAVVALADAGAFTGAVADLGCGTGEHTILLARRGYDVLGADGSAAAVERAAARAAAAGVTARFTVADALDPAGPGPFDTVLDSALFHVFDAGDQARYARALAGIVRPGGVVHLLALARTGADAEFGPVIDESEIRTAFAGPDWSVVSVGRTTYRGVVTPDLAASCGEPAGTRVDVPAHLARIVRA
ncbi:Methyltransferase [Pseudonocardia sp. Ae168_Ps1]|uniref:class I SAM-dependent methyltransferase n=1 Tax=unclassified Pseudonocardia TaxID=2619320 RepID=UPI00094AF53D|nr:MULTISPECIES: class I SAM-dependent methyltransferase [unclassified Pseudonocardia]OLL72194.1 Methyltransferase [Pseudonocardia sp. Ae150A_Ps1]OLL78163.1 Methyltransferase [Pseudonocardia sp. Ae168_Ps1]OLL87715.1 Methyltransferase [Pseudonocardia sp. Ae263_Ps1]OLL92258.1 Methyltransferase [Pseudonocardia sp. Ae356_Ps1]